MYALDLDTAYSLALSNSFKVKLAKMAIDKVDIEKNKLWMSFLPEVNYKLSDGEEKYVIDGVDTSDSNNKDNTAHSLEMRLSLFNGGKDYLQYKIDSANYSLATCELELTQLQIKLQVLELYIQVYKLQQQHKLQQQIVVKHGQKVAQLKQQLDVSMTTKRQFLQAQSTEYLAQRQLQTLALQISDYSLQLQQILQTPVAELEIPQQTSVSNYSEFNLHPSVLQALYELKVSNANIHKQLTQFMPQLNLLANWQQQQRLIYLDDTGGQRVENTLLSLELTVPVFTGATNITALRLSYANYEMASVRYKMRQDEIKHQMQTIKHKLATSSKQLTLATKFTTSAQEILESETLDYQYGVINYLPVIEATIALLQSQQEQLLAQAEELLYRNQLFLHLDSLQLTD